MELSLFLSSEHESLVEHRHALLTKSTQNLRLFSLDEAAGRSFIPDDLFLSCALLVHLLATASVHQHIRSTGSLQKHGLAPIFNPSAPFFLHLLLHTKLPSVQYLFKAFNQTLLSILFCFGA